jgi:hypothetical protein
MVVNEPSLRAGLEPRQSAQQRHGPYFCCPAVIREVEQPVGRLHCENRVKLTGANLPRKMKR